MKSVFKFICCGNVDDGKSTLIGRLLLDTNNVKKDQLEDALKASQKNGSKQIELAMLLDGLLSEREQQITIDIAHRFFDYQDIRFHILDCPGHEQYTKNMAIAAAEANTAIVVIDALKGIKPQTLKHIEICNLFQIKNILVCLTKTDLLKNSKGQTDLKKLKPLEKEVQSILKNYNFNYEIIPVSAVTGFNTNFVLKFLYKNALKHIESEEKNSKQILHVLNSKLFKNTRYYYAKPVFQNKEILNEKFTVYPQNTPVTITENFDNGSFNILENVDISKGDCLSNTEVFISNKISHKSIFFDKKTPSMLFKHGSSIRRVVQLTPSSLELDGELVFNNIEDIKQNGFGIFIDETTKKTLGCAVFSNNQKECAPSMEIINYIIYGATHIKRVQKALEIKSQFHPAPFILDPADLKFKILATEELIMLAEYINSQGTSTICLAETPPKKQNPNCILINLDQEK